MRRPCIGDGDVDRDQIGIDFDYVLPAFSYMALRGRSGRRSCCHRLSVNDQAMAKASESFRNISIEQPGVT